MQKVHWNDLEDIDLPEVEHKPIPKEETVAKEQLLYVIDGVQYEKSYVDQIDPEIIESVNIIKDTLVIREMGIVDFDSIIEIKLKK